LSCVQEANTPVGAFPSGEVLRQLVETLERLRASVPTAAPAVRQKRTPRLAVEAAGLLLLARIVQRLGWADLCGDPSCVPWGETRMFQILMVGIGSAVFGRAVTEMDRLDLAVEIFAGIGGEASTTALRQSLASVDTLGRRALLERLMPGIAYDQAAAEWTATFDTLAARLIVEFASLIRGFRRSPRPAIVQQFLRTSGWVHADELAVSVLLEPSPYHVALHISGMDNALPSVNWMGGRRLVFTLVGL
jgi:hypothetical protein